MEQQAISGYFASGLWQRGLHSVRFSTLPVYMHTSIPWHVFSVPLFLNLSLVYSKLWDTYSGDCLQSFPHNHIVRSVALSPSSSYLLTGGQEKKVRMFDLNRPDAEPDSWPSSRWA